MTVEDVSVSYVLSDNMTYEGNSIAPPDDIIENRTLLWYIGDFTCQMKSWTTSFDVRPITTGNQQPVSVAPYPEVTYGGNNLGDNVTITGTLDVSPNANDELSITLPNDTMITRDDLFTGGFEGYSGKAIHIHVRPKQHAELDINGSKYPLLIDRSYDIWSNSMTVNLYQVGEGVGNWKVDINASNGTIDEYSTNVSFPQSFVNVTAPETLDIDILTPDGQCIGQLISITGCALLKNTGNATDIIVNFYVDGFPLRPVESTAPHNDTGENVNVSTMWIPMFSGRHTIAMQIYVLSYDGTEFWTEAQGPNEATNSTTIYIRRVG